ncbi:ATP-binding protein [Actinomadura parmotrematis]|uniref:ATP-binding protein n=1 Tax=Actinomadura parmotrematis TaxID=2864039 RepID=A0ABS7FYM7_9ACTN|nr:ATP-binding protein [Actinomadura parmotrematis]MBW8485537.1 ATP-binding protein [Actinomadura parmotrematis]
MSAGLARTLTEQRLRKWDCFHLIGDAVQIVAELVANAAEATPRRQIRFQLSRDIHGIVIAVWDASPNLPKPKPIIELALEDLDLTEELYDANGGWGLPIVQALSTSCGYTRDPNGGKWIWARLNPVVRAIY